MPTKIKVGGQWYRVRYQISYAGTMHFLVSSNDDTNLHKKGENGWIPKWLCEEIEYNNPE